MVEIIIINWIGRNKWSFIILVFAVLQAEFWMSEQRKVIQPNDSV